MTVTALMIGGPADGEVHTLAAPLHQVIFTAPARREDFLSRWTQERVSAMRYTHVVYRREAVVMFGSSLHVYVYEDWPKERVEATLAAHLLSPLAHQLIEEAAPVEDV